MNEIIILLNWVKQFYFILFISFPNWPSDSIVESNFAKMSWTTWSSFRLLPTPHLYWNLGFKKYAIIKLSRFSIL